MQQTRYELQGYAEFEANSKFRLAEIPFQSSAANDGEIELGIYELPRRSQNAHTYRLGHPLADRLIEQAKERSLPAAEVQFSYDPSKGKVSILKPFLGKSGSLSLREVKLELSNHNDPDVIESWAKDNAAIFLIPSPEELLFVQKIFSVSHFQALISKKALLKGTPVADPFVIAAAAVRAGTVVTEERLKPNAAKIPNVCDHFGVNCTNLEGFMNQKNWCF